MVMNAMDQTLSSLKSSTEDFDIDFNDNFKSCLTTSKLCKSHLENAIKEYDNIDKQSKKLQNSLKNFNIFIEN